MRLFIKLSPPDKSVCSSLNCLKAWKSILFWRNFQLCSLKLHYKGIKNILKCKLKWKLSKNSPCSFTSFKIYWFSAFSGQNSVATIDWLLHFYKKAFILVNSWKDSEYSWKFLWCTGYVLSIQNKDSSSIPGVSVQYSPKVQFGESLVFFWGFF